jgi:thymidine kinase
MYVLINMSYIKKVGAIHIIFGPMFSGKSSELLKIIKKNDILDKKQLVINNKLDIRYGENKIISHDKKEYDCLGCSELIPLLTNQTFLDAEIIIIDESHFFNDLEDFVIQSCDLHNKIVYIAGLNGDYKKESIGQINQLCPKADTITKLDALCIVCKDGTPAIFSKRIVNQESKILVGTSEYIAVCRKHY